MGDLEVTVILPLGGKGLCEGLDSEDEPVLRAEEIHARAHLAVQTP
jgi:hypothetical protein